MALLRIFRREITGIMATETSNHAVERTATRFAFTFCLASTLSLRAERGLGGRRSLYSR